MFSAFPLTKAEETVGHKVFYVLNKWHVLLQHVISTACGARLPSKIGTRTYQDKKQRKTFSPDTFSSLPDSSPVKITHRNTGTEHRPRASKVWKWYLALYPLSLVLQLKFYSFYRRQCFMFTHTVLSMVTHKPGCPRKLKLSQETETAFI